MSGKRRALIGCGIVAAALVVASAVLWSLLEPPERAASVLAEEDASPLAFVGVTVVNPELDRSPERTLVVEGDRIAAVGSAGADVPDGARVLEEYRGHVVLPGLIDMHAHLPPATPLNLTAYVTLLNLAHGITTIRDPGDFSGTAVDAARAGIESGEMRGPRIFSCGPFVTSGEKRWLNSKVVSGPDEARRAVEEIAEAGHDCVKSYEEMTVPEIRALVAAAEARGMPVLSHVPYGLGYEEALLPGVEHLLGIPPPESLARNHMVDRLAEWSAVDEARLDRIVEVTLEHGIANTPTLVLHHRLLGLGRYPEMNDDPHVRLMPRVFRDVVWHPHDGLPIYRDLPPALFESLRASLPKKHELVRRLWEAGATLYLGTDCLQPFVTPAAALHEEMGLFAAAGIPVEAIWAMGTWRAGDGLGVPQLGRIEPGAPADLLVFRDDPAHDLDRLDSLVAVVARGRLYERRELDATLDAWREHMKQPAFDRLSVGIARPITGEVMLRDY